MATGRTLERFRRLYIDGYDLSNDMRNIDPLSCVFDVAYDDNVGLDIKEGYIGQATISPGTLNAIFDDTVTTSAFARLKASSGNVNLMVPLGIQAAPAAGCPVFCGTFPQTGYQASGSGMVLATVGFGTSSKDSTAHQFAQPFGILLHASSLENAVNTGEGIDQGGETLKGGYMMYQVFTAAGTVNKDATIKVQDCDTHDGTYVDLLTSGVISCANPTNGVVALGVNAHVQQFVRWQIVLSPTALHTATSVTFALAFVRNYI
jgi:hypothetical protein